MKNRKSDSNILRRLNKFLSNVYEPIMHAGFSLFWFLALAGFLLIASNSRQPFIIDLKFIAGTATIFLVLFFLRVVDEIKDFEYDKLYNPDRPLVTKLVSFRDLNIFLAGSAILTIVLNLVFLGWFFALIVVLDMLYGLFLIRLEKKSEKIADGMFLNLYVTYPVNIALSLYIFVFCNQFYSVELSFKTIMVMIVFIVAFLHHEIGRKTCWPHKVKEDKRHYSSEIGGRNSALLATGIAIFSTLGVIIFSAPWNLSGTSVFTGILLIFSLAPAFFGAYKFFKSEKKSDSKTSDAPMTTFAMGFLFLFYLFLIIHTISVCGIVFSKSALFVIASGLVVLFVIGRWLKNISMAGSIYINSTEELIAGNDMFFTAQLKASIMPEKIFNSYKKLVKDNDYLKSKWVFDEKKKRYKWSLYSSDELNEFLNFERNHLMNFHTQEDIYSEYIPTNTRLPFRITLVSENRIVFSFNHVFTNGLNALRWIEKFLAEYYNEISELENVSVGYGMMKRLKNYLSVFYAGIYLTTFLKNKGKNLKTETIDLTYGKHPVKLKNGYSIRSYAFSQKNTSEIIKKAGEKRNTVSTYICTVFSESFFNNSPDKNRICISAPTDLLDLVPEADLSTAGNYTGSLIFQVFRNKNLGEQIKENYKQFRKLVPLGIAKIMNFIFLDYKKMGDHFLKQAEKPFNERAPLEFCTFAFSSLGVNNLSLINEYLDSCSFVCFSNSFFSSSESRSKFSVVIEIMSLSLNFFNESATHSST